MKYGRTDLYQVWRLLEELMDSRLTPDSASIESGVPWAHLPFGRPMVKSM